MWRVVVNIYFLVLFVVYIVRLFDNMVKFVWDEVLMEFYNLFWWILFIYNYLVNWKNKIIKNFKLYCLILVENGFVLLMIVLGWKLLELYFEYMLFIIYGFVCYLNIWRSINCYKLRSFFFLKSLLFIFGYYVFNCSGENYIIKDWIIVEMIW